MAASTKIPVGAAYSEPSSPRHSRCRDYCVLFIIWLIRFAIDVVLFRIQRVFELLFKFTIRRGVKVKHAQYGKGWREVCDLICPVGVSMENNDKPAIVYVHGGGWMIVSKDLMRPYVTYMARKGGHRVVNMDYPLSPETRFPTALISLLRLLHWLKQTHGVDRVILMGDSAGANMCALATMLLRQPKFLTEMAFAANFKDVLTWTYPLVVRNIFFYGLFDEEALCAPTVATLVCREVLHLHRCKAVFGGKCTASDFHHYLDAAFPRTLIITGTHDPLFPGNQNFYQLLKSKGIDASLEIFHGQTHGFHSFCWSMQRYQLQRFILSQLQS